jgi:DNA-binding transcriptional regulator PaaX
MDCNIRYMQSAGDQVGWTVLILRLPSEPSRHRVAVWRELRRVGAIQLGQGNWALPAAPAFADVVDKIVELVSHNEGEVLVLTASAADEPTGAKILGLYDDARRAEWTEFESECAKCLAELEREIRTEKFTLAELDEEEQNVDRLRRWHRELRSRDLFASVPIGETQAHLDVCVTVLDRFTALVYTAVGLD